MSRPPEPPGPDDEGPQLGAVDDIDLPVLEERVELPAGDDGVATGDDPESRLRQAIDAALEGLRERLLAELSPLLRGRRERSGADE